MGVYRCPRTSTGVFPEALRRMRIDLSSWKTAAPGPMGRWSAPPAASPFLARWVDLDRLFEKPSQRGQGSPSRLIPTRLERLRALVAAAAYLSQWRGTGKGLMLFLETATGAHGFAIEERVPGSDGKPRPFHFRVHAPRELTSYRALIQRIIESEKPAYVTYEIEFNGTARG